MSPPLADRQANGGKPARSSLVAVVTAVLLVAAACYGYLSMLYYQEFLEESNVTLAYFSESLEIPLWTYDEATVRELGEAALQGDSVTHVRILDDLGDSLFSSGSGPLDSDASQRVAVSHAGKPVGALEIAFSGEALAEKRNRSLLLTLAASAVVLLFVAWNWRLRTEMWQRRKVEAELAAALSTAESATASKSAFLANMSHEIRTPMNAIIGLSHLAQDTDLSEAQRDYLEKISSAANNLLGIVNEILDLSKIEAGKLELERVDFDLTRVLDELAAVIGVRASEKGLDFSVDTEPDVPTGLNGDPLRLNQVLINLANNAIKFTDAGGIQVTVKQIDQAPGSVRLQFEVRDSGIGITDDQMDSLFQAFTQADTSTTRRFGGTGLGLSISKQLVELMDGDLGVDSSPGQGSTFWFTARFGLSTSPAVSEGRLPGADVAEVKSRARRELAGAQLLLVEDNEINRQVATELLQQVGIAVVAANDGLEGLQALQARPDDFDAVLMDVQMPVMDGYQSAREMRSDPRFADIPILAMTANVMRDDRQLALDSGMNDIITKPINVQQMFEQLCIWVRVPEKRARPATIPDQASNQRCEEVPVIAGIDTTTGLLRTGGNAQQYLKLLFRFRREFGDCHVRIRSAINAGDPGKARHDAHSLKGVAGNLGVEAVQAAAHALEELLAAGGDAGNGLAALEQELTMAVAGLSVLDQLPLQDVEPVKLTAVEIHGLLDRLEALVEDNNVGAAGLVAKLERALLQGPAREQVLQLSESIEAFDFDRAEEALQELRCLLHTSGG